MAVPDRAGPVWRQQGARQLADRPGVRGRARDRHAGQRGDRRLPGVPRVCCLRRTGSSSTSGPSYVVVSAITVALLYGSWLARAAAALDLALLVVVGNIFGGLSQLDVSAVGHVTAIAVGAVLGSLLVWQLRRRPQTGETWPTPASAIRADRRGLLGSLDGSRGRRHRRPGRPGPAQRRPAPPGRVARRAEHPDEEPHRPVGLVRHRDRGPHRDQGDTTDRPMASSGRSVNDRAAAGGPIIRLKISRAPTTGSAMLVASATTTRKHISIRYGSHAARLAELGHHRGEHQRAVQHHDRGDAHRAQRGDRGYLVHADAEHLAEQQRVISGAYSTREAEEQRAEPEHHHQGQGHGHVVAAAAAEPADAERAEQGEHAQARPGY